MTRPWLITGGQENGLVLPIKDNVVDGNVIVHDWAGAWFGIIRNHVGGNVIVFHVVGARVGAEAPFVGVPDSTEIATNTIGGNLMGSGNTPHAQLGDTILEGWNGQQRQWSTSSASAPDSDVRETASVGSRTDAKGGPPQWASLRSAPELPLPALRAEPAAGAGLQANCKQEGSTEVLTAAAA